MAAKHLPRNASPKPELSASRTEHRPKRKPGRPIMELNHFEIAKNWLESYQQHLTLEQKTHELFKLWGQDNELLDIRSPQQQHYDLLVEQILGEELVGWLLWWQWDCEGGTRGEFQLNDGPVYQLNQLTFEEFFFLAKRMRMDKSHNTATDISA